MTLFLLNILRWNDVQEWGSYLKGGIDQSDTLDMRVYYHDPNSRVLVLNNSMGLAFLHMDINWIMFFKMCSPKYCEITKPMNLF